MDLLKRELQKKRKAATDDFGGRSFLRQSELEQRLLLKYRKPLAKASATAPSRGSAAPAATATAAGPDAAARAAESNPNPSSSAAGDATAAAKKTTRDAAQLPEERRIDELDLPRHEVVRRLRVLRQPVTLYGEDDAARVECLALVLKSGVIDDTDDLDMTQGQTNNFLPDMIEMSKRQKTGRTPTLLIRANVSD